ncbi:MAG: hypothetical protein ABSB63_18060 [Spirochaetia bacterium]|jgi:hypothetical protein
MAAIDVHEVVGQILDVLREAFEGPKERWSYFTDNRSDAGLFGTLGKLAAADASRTRGKTSIAAHVHHVIYGLNASARWIEGDRTTHNWKESWTTGSVNDQEWARMLDKLKVSYQDTRRDIELYASSSKESMGGVIGALAHVAYHLGAIRQKVSFES